MKTHRSVLALALGIALTIPAALSIADSSKGGFVPDPGGVSSTKQWVFDVQVRQGVPSIASAKLVTLDKPTSTARVLGRFAIELWIGKELLDRVRFDVPLLDDPTKRKDRRLRGPEFAVNMRLSAKMIDSPRATTVVLVDRATGQQQTFAWPPGSDGHLIPFTEPAKLVADAGSDAPVVDASAPVVDASSPDAN